MCRVGGGYRIDGAVERVLAALVFLYFLQGLQRQISPSGDLEEEQGTKVIAASHLGQDMDVFRRLFWKRKSRAFSRDAVGPLISSSRQ